ncbi:hypothetical protein XENTR_v10002900 [Xenopus tropicalis]|nr:hypothetical protein XENTR_v10002900 [Xenopus tropicalis]
MCANNIFWIGTSTDEDSLYLFYRSVLVYHLYVSCREPSLVQYYRVCWCFIIIYDKRQIILYTVQGF